MVFTVLMFAVVQIFLPCLLYRDPIFVMHIQVLALQEKNLQFFGRHVGTAYILRSIASL